MNPDRSNCPSFYDPEHPYNNRMPTTGCFHWWVEVKCHDPLENETIMHGVGVEAHDRDAAIELAIEDAEKWGYQPLRIESCGKQ